MWMDWDRLEQIRSNWRESIITSCYLSLKTLLSVWGVWGSGRLLLWACPLWTPHTTEAGQGHTEHPVGVTVCQDLLFDQQPPAPLHPHPGQGHRVTAHLWHLTPQHYRMIPGESTRLHCRDWNGNLEIIGDLSSVFSNISKIDYSEKCTLDI